MHGAVLLLCGGTALLLVVDLMRDRNTQDSHFLALAAIEVAVLVQLVWGCIDLAGTDRDIAGATLVSYLVSAVLAPVVGAVLSLTERSRAGTAIVLLAVLTVAGLEVRVIDLWGAGA